MGVRAFLSDGPTSYADSSLHLTDFVLSFTVDME